MLKDAKAGVPITNDLYKSSSSVNALLSFHLILYVNDRASLVDRCLWLLRLRHAVNACIETVHFTRYMAGTSFLFTHIMDMLSTVSAQLQ